MPHYFNMLFWSLRLLKVVPFKIFSSVKIEKAASANLSMQGRLILGPNASQQTISGEKIVLSFGENSNVRLGHSISLGPGVKIIVKKNASLQVGDATYFTSDMHIEVMKNVSIGNNCAISWGVTIIDDDHHEISYEGKKNTELSGSVLIGNHVWIGCNATILKNAQIGNNCVVAANSVVRGQFPDDCLIGGSPAIIIKQNISWK